MCYLPGVLLVSPVMHAYACKFHTPSVTPDTDLVPTLWHALERM